MENNKISVLLNEADIRRMAEIACSKDVNKGADRIINIPKIIAIIMVFMTIASVGVSFMFGFPAQPKEMKIATGIIFAVIMLIGLVILIIMKKRSKKVKKRINLEKKETFFQREMQRRSTGFSSCIYTFENEGICVNGKNVRFIIFYKELQECHEYSDGLFFRYEWGQVLWMPARFFTKSIADSVSGKMSDVFGRKFFQHDKISAPEIPEAVSVEEFILPQSESELTLDYKLKNYRLGRRFLIDFGKLLKNILIILYFCLTALFGAMSVEGIKDLVKKVGEPLKISILFEVCAVFLVLNLFVYFILIFVMNFIVPILKINKWSNNWYKDGVTLEFHGEGILEKVAAGDNFVPWENVASVKNNAGDMVITDKTGRSLIIPKREIKGNRKEIESIVVKHLSQGECESNK